LDVDDRPVRYGHEGLLGVAFRDKLPDGTMIGGTFNALEKGLAEIKIPAGARYLATIFVLIFAAFVGMDAMRLSGGAMIGAWIITILFLVLAYYLVRGTPCHRWERSSQYCSRPLLLLLPLELET